MIEKHNFTAEFHCTISLFHLHYLIKNCD